MFGEGPMATNDIELISCKQKLWKVSASSTAKKCRNYIREIVENLDLTPNPSKAVIALSIGLYSLVPVLFANKSTKIRFA